MFEDRFTGGVTTDGTPYLEIQHRGTVASIIPQSGDMVTATSVYRLSSIDDFPMSESEPIVELDATAIQDVTDDFEPATIRLDVLSETGNGGAIDYFDGYSATRPLHIDDQFGTREFDRAVTQLGEINRKAFTKTTDKLGIDLDVDEAMSSDESVDDTPGFQ